MSDFRRVIFDIETNGLLKDQGAVGIFVMDKIHCMVIMDIDTGEIVDYVNNDECNDIEDGVRLLMEAEYISGHNILDFDIPAVQSLYPYFQPTARLFDTLVMTRMCFADVKEKDFRMMAQGKLEGRFFGLHSLDAWGERLGKSKGDYKKGREELLKQIHKDDGKESPTKEELHSFVWGTWSEEMHEYCINDVEVSKVLWDKIQEMEWSQEAISIEHNIHALMIQQERNGFYFDVDKAEKLAKSLQEEYDAFAEEAKKHIGRWFRPARWHGADTMEPAHGENADRRSWGMVVEPKKTMNRIKSNTALIEQGNFKKMNGSVVEGAPFVKVEVRDFNPNSRQQIVDRLSHLYGWTPQDFTEKGNPRVDDEILRNLVDHIPLAETLAEIFYYKKRIGMVADGKNGWLKLLRDDMRIHGRVNVGGTVSGRGTHAAPNVSQVPGVNAKEFKDYVKGLDFIARHDEAGTLVSAEWKEKDDGNGEWKIQVRGREGDHGWDCRELFTVPEGYKLVGSDLSGVEFRCLADLVWQFDDGELIEIVLNGDIHQKNADLAGISRSVAKRLLYATMYGGGMAKLGSIVEPLSSEVRQMSLGKELHAKLMAAMPALKKAIRAIQTEMRVNRGTIAGRDGRRLYARSKHSVLNLRLQSDGALIAKKWCLLVDDAFYDEGWTHGVGHEYYFCSWSHDEIQVAVKEEYAERAAEIMKGMASVAGDYFKFKCPIDAESVIGDNWAETH